MRARAPRGLPASGPQYLYPPAGPGDNEKSRNLDTRAGSPVRRGRRWGNTHSPWRSKGLSGSYFAAAFFVGAAFFVAAFFPAVFPAARFLAVDFFEAFFFAAVFFFAARFLVAFFRRPT